MTNEPSAQAIPAQPVEPRIVLLVASEGGVQALCQIVSSLPDAFPLPVVIVQHRGAQRPSMLRQVLARCTKLSVQNVSPGVAPLPQTVYLAPPDCHVLISSEGAFALTDGKRINHLLSSADPLFASAAKFYGEGVVAGVLTGNDGDGSKGAVAVKDAGGIVFVQDSDSSVRFAMPRSALATGAVDAILPLADIGSWLAHIARS